MFQTTLHQIHACSSIYCPSVRFLGRLQNSCYDFLIKIGFGWAVHWIMCKINVMPSIVITEWRIQPKFRGFILLLVKRVTCVGMDFLFVLDESFITFYGWTSILHQRFCMIKFLISVVQAFFMILLIWTAFVNKLF